MLYIKIYIVKKETGRNILILDCDIIGNVIFLILDCDIIDNVIFHCLHTFVYNLAINKPDWTEDDASSYSSKYPSISLMTNQSQSSMLAGPNALRIILYQL
jgi:hypothetical protein